MSNLYCNITTLRFRPQDLTFIPSLIDRPIVHLLTQLDIDSRPKETYKSNEHTKTKR